MRATYKVEVEVTAEVQAEGAYSNERLSEDLHDAVFTAVRESELDVVIVTVSPSREEKLEAPATHWNLDDFGVKEES